MSEHQTDCREPEGIATGLVDAIITAVRVLRRHYPDHIPPEALADLVADEDLQWLVEKASRVR